MPSTRVVVLTGSAWRHDYFRMSLANDPEITVLASYCESDDRGIDAAVRGAKRGNILRARHLAHRKVVERDFFGLYCASILDHSKPIHISKGDINSAEHVDRISELNPDLIVAYGCSIIRSDLLQRYRGKFMNMHLGLSPYYRGSGTNFWPFVNDELSCVGVTFMHIDEGVDTGTIIHQRRASMVAGDTIHTIGNRLIRDAAVTCQSLISHWNTLDPEVGSNFSDEPRRYYKKRDFTEAAVEAAYDGLRGGLITRHLAEQRARDAKCPIRTQRSLT